MLALPILVITTLLLEVSLVESRPRDKDHQGLYDEWKTIPFVDNPSDETDELFNKHLKELGKQDNTNKLPAKYMQLYEKYNLEHHRTIGDGNDSDVGIVTETTGKFDVDIKPVEGGLDLDLNERKLKPDQKRKNRKGGKKHRHNKKSKREKKLKRQKRIKEDDVDDDDDTLSIDIEKFYKEHPHFKSNVATITDESVTKKETSKPSTTTTEAVPVTEEDELLSDSEDDADQKDADDFDEDDDDDDGDETTDSVSNDESSEAFDDYYDYYDEEGDSSYSSSEERAEQEMARQTSELFKNYDRMYGDQPVQSEDESDKTHVKTEDKDKNNKNYQLEKKDKENIPKTDVEPSTSPNPPTSKKDAKSVVTEPAYPQWKERVETWNLIESKPFESCTDDIDCASGRMCKFGLCLCGQPDFCVGHYKPVCGSDGRLYPSHCELHRTACVLGVHIRLGALDECQPTVVKVIDVESSITHAGVDETVATTAATDIDTKNENQNDGTDVKLSSENEFASSSEEHVNNMADNNDADQDKSLEIISDDKKAALMNQLTGSETNDDEEEEEDDDEIANSSDVVSEEEEDDDSDTMAYDEDDDDDDSYDDDDDDMETTTTAPIADDSKSDILDAKKFADYYDDDDYYADDYDDDYDSDDSSDSKDSKDEESIEEHPDDTTDKPSLVPLFCTPDQYLKFKADVLEYHCIFFEELHCDRQTQEEKQKLAALMFNYFDRDFSGHVEKEELWEMQLREHMDDLSSLCTLLDLATFDELGERDGKLSVDEFIQAFDIPDVLEHKTEIVPLLATVGNGLEIKCDITDSADVVWKRNDMNLGILDYPGISVLGDGSLYLETIGFHHVGNVCCHDRKKPSIKQIHMLTVQKPPHVIVSVESHDFEHGSSIDVYCHAEGYPKPTVNWMYKDQVLQQGAKYHIQTYTNTLTILEADYKEDSGTYKCVASNSAGKGEGTVDINVHNLNVTENFVTSKREESFIIFHDNGYTLHEPSECLTQRHVTPDFGNFFFIPDELDAPPSLCEKGFPCIWGGAINVKDTFVYATQPRENRVIVIDVTDSYNPNQVIFTDHTPVSLHYIAHLDEVWVLCWNGESDNGSKTVMIIRNASQKKQHHAIHTQPIGNRFDQVQDYFLPSDSELHHPYMFGYAVHYGQQGLFKVNLEEKKYTRAVDFTRYDCVPQAVAFVPLGGQCLVRCVKRTSYGNDITNILTLDYITDTVIENVTVLAVPYVSPDVRNMVLVEEDTGKISVHRITENGKIMHQFDVSINSPVSKGTFHKSSYNHGYDLYLVSKENPAIYSISLENGKIDSIKDIGQPDPDMFLPWFHNNRPLVSGDVFSDYLGTTATSSMLILNGKHHTIQCDYTDLQNPAVIAYTYLNKT